MTSFLVSCSPGLNELLRDELVEICPETAVEIQSVSMLRFEGSWVSAAKVAAHSRIASRIMVSLRAFSAKNPEMLYDQVRRISWPDYFSPLDTFAVFSHGELVGERLESMNFASLKIKDALCDEFRKKGQDRPSVSRQEPDFRVEAHFFGGKCEISLALHREALHRRGYRQDSGEAPLRENRAAALLRFCGFSLSTLAFLDPFCGSGTLPIEAALMEARVAPCLLRPEGDNFVVRGGAFQPLSDAYRLEVRQARDTRLKKIDRPIFGSDLDRRTLREAQGNANRAGVANFVRFGEQDARTLKLTDSHLIVTNPPFGERLGSQDSVQQLISDFVRNLKHECAPAELGLILPVGPLIKSVGLKPERKCQVENGPLETQYLFYRIMAGKFAGRNKPESGESKAE